MSRIRFLFRQDSADAWTSNNPTLAAGEIGVELDSANGVSPKFKIGNGILAWNDSSFNYFINDSDQSALAGAGGGASGASFEWGGDRGLFIQGYTTDWANGVDYFDITTAGNAADFGDTSSARREEGAVSDGNRVVVIGGQLSASSSYAPVNIMEYFSTATPGNATDFGDQLNNRYGCSCASDGTKGFAAGGWTGSVNENSIQVITIATPSNATDFGDLTSGRNTRDSGISDGTYALFPSDATQIDYITTASASNATDFGDLLANGGKAGGCCDGTYGLFAGQTSDNNQIQYVTVATPANASDFGDLTVAKENLSTTSNSTTAAFCGGTVANVAQNVIETLTIQTLGNASDFGDLTLAASASTSSSGNAA